MQNTAVDVVAKRQKEVPRELGLLDESLVYLAKLIEDLEADLASILTLPVPEDAMPKEEEGLVPLAATIRLLKCRVVEKSHTVERMINSLEL